MDRTPDLTVTVLLRRVELLEAELARTQDEALTDRLTRLGNRLALERRASSRDGYFVVADLNNFKAAQDASPFGHAYGDAVLLEFADFLRDLVRGTERVAIRQGGDEFVVWCPDRFSALRVKRATRAWLSQDKLVSATAGMGKDMVIADHDMYLSKRVRKKVMHGA